MTCSPTKYENRVGAGFGVALRYWLKAATPRDPSSSTFIVCARESWSQSEPRAGLQLHSSVSGEAHAVFCCNFERCILLRTEVEFLIAGIDKCEATIVAIDDCRRLLAEVIPVQRTCSLPHVQSSGGLDSCRSKRCFNAAFHLHERGCARANPVHIEKRDTV